MGEVLGPEARKSINTVDHLTTRKLFLQLKLQIFRRRYVLKRIKEDVEGPYLMI